MPDFLVSDNMGQTQGVGPVRIGVMRQGIVFEQIGTDILNAGWDPSQGINAFPHGLVRRFMGQIWTATQNNSNAPTQICIRPYDEGGIDDWQVIADFSNGAPTAKGAIGASLHAASDNRLSTILEVLTADRPYLVGTYQYWSPSDPAFWVYNPDTNAVTFVVASAGAWASPTVFINGFVHDGVTYWATSAAIGQIISFDPSTSQIITLPSSGFGYSGGAAANNQYKPHFFSLHNRLFCATMDITSRAGENAYIARIVEFSFGVWTEVPGLNTFLGDTSNQGGRMAIFKLSVNKVMLIGHGSENNPNGGLIATVLTTVGDAAGGALQSTTIAPTNAVIPAALRPTGVSYGGSGTLATSTRCYGTTVTDDPTGNIRHFLYVVPDGGLAVTVPILYEVFDDISAMVINPTTPDMDSNFSFPHSFYGGGAESGGIDGSTRYVSCQARGWEKGNIGVRIKVSAHGDGLVISHRGIAGGPFTVGEIITGVGGGSGTLIGDGTNEGIYLRDVTGTFVADEVITGGTSSATATINGVLLHSGVTGSALEIGEVVAGVPSGASATITQIGLGGTGEQLVKVSAVTSGPFASGDVITGGTNGGTATLSSAPLGSHGGAANKTIRARFSGGKDIPSGFATMVLGTGVGATVSKGTGPSSSDELINVVADGAPGDTPLSFEWDYITDGVPELLAAQMTFEIDRI